MNLTELKLQATHWAHPLVTPVVAATGVAAAIDSLGVHMPLNIWTETIQLVIVFAVMRTVIFFEFRVHETRERRLYDGIVKSSDSFDQVWDHVRDRLKKLEEWRKDAQDDLDDHTALLASHDRRIRDLEDHPVIRRMGGGQGAS